MNLTEFQENRAKIKPEELARFYGMWVALSSDGRRIVAGAENLADLDALIRSAGEDPEKVALEFIQTDDNFVAGAESI